MVSSESAITEKPTTYGVEKQRHSYGYVKYITIRRSILVLDAVALPRLTFHRTLHRKKRTETKRSGVLEERLISACGIAWSLLTR